MNSFGRRFRVSIFGESHGELIGITLDGVKPGIELTKDDFTKDLIRRRSGSQGTTSRIEKDDIQIVSGILNNLTTGSPVTIISKNRDIQSSDYLEFKDCPRPGHADFPASIKFHNFNDKRGGGHFSGRLTLPIVAAGVVAKKMIDCQIDAELIELGGIKSSEKYLWEDKIKNTLKEKNSIGGIVECRIKHPSVGLGEPFFDSLESLISHAIFSIPGVRGIEFGDGFSASKMKGSEHNDPLIKDGNTIKPAKSGSGGINGGISNGGEIIFRVAFKPTSSIGLTQKTLNIKSDIIQELTIKGRHDICFALRTPIIVEAMTAIVLADLYYFL